MKLEKALKRDKARFKNRHGMKVSGKSVFTIAAVLIKKSKKGKGK